MPCSVWWKQLICSALREKQKMFLSMLQQMLRGDLLISFSKLLIELCLLMVNTNKIPFVVSDALFYSLVYI